MDTLYLGNNQYIYLDTAIIDSRKLFYIQFSYYDGISDTDIEFVFDEDEFKDFIDRLVKIKNEEL